ncbi:MAG TPA: Flp family type IVb pilin [Xanthobacteraceae bacterium]|jgi:pilus assembly protein Flp/PilA
MTFIRSALARLNRFARFATDRRGATAIEYGLMAALISVAIMSTVFSMGQGIKDTLYGQITNSLANMSQ